MKLARIADIWRTLRKSDKRILRRFKVKWSGIPRLTDGEVEISRPITLICGENGAGKSSLLHALVHAVVPADVQSDNIFYCRPRVGMLELVEIEVTDADDGTRVVVGDTDVGAHFFPTTGEHRLAFIDAGMHVPAMLDFIKSDARFSDHTEGVDPAELDKKTLELVSFIVGRSYERIAVYEISDSSLDGLLPYFRVESQGASYETPDMGYGEIAVIYILWMLGRVDSGALILIEEPETFLSPRAQTALVDAIAKYVIERQLVVVMTSHSGAIAAKMTNEEIVYTTRSAGRVTFHNPAKTSDLVARLGLVPERVFLLFVEDAVAETFARVMIDGYSDRLSASSEYLQCNGNGGVLRAIEVIPQGLRQVAHIAVLDGDSRSYSGNDDRVVFLPGAVAPEILLIDHAKGMGDAGLAELLDVAEVDVARASAHADGEELHNWIYTFAKTLAIPHSEVLRKLAVSWARGNETQVSEFVRNVEKFSAAAPR